MIWLASNSTSVPASLDTLIIQALVAAGTLLLASATFWLAWNSVRERKAAEARELAIGAYNPLRVEISRWVNLEAAYTSPLGDTWASLKQTQLHLVRRIPKPITSQLDAAETDVQRVEFLRVKVSGKVTAKTSKLADEFYPQSEPDSYVLLRLMVAKMFVRSIDTALVWLSRKSLKDYVNDYVAKQFPDNAWELEFMIGNTFGGGTKEAEEFSRKLFDFLDSDKDAMEFRNLLERISRQGKLINFAIEKELRKH